MSISPDWETINGTDGTNIVRFASSPTPLSAARGVKLTGSGVNATVYGPWIRIYNRGETSYAIPTYDPHVAVYASNSTSTFTIKMRLYDADGDYITEQTAYSGTAQAANTWEFYGSNIALGDQTAVWGRISVEKGTDDYDLFVDLADLPQTHSHGHLTRTSDITVVKTSGWIRAQFNNIDSECFTETTSGASSSVKALLPGLYYINVLTQLDAAPSTSDVSVRIRHQKLGGAAATLKQSIIPTTGVRIGFSSAIVADAQEDIWLEINNDANQDNSILTGSYFLVSRTGRAR